MKENPPWEDTSRSISQEPSRLKCNLEVNRHVPKSQPPVSVLSQWTLLTFSVPVSLRSNLVLTSHLRLGLPTGVFLSSLPCVLYTSTRLSLLDLMAITVFDEAYSHEALHSHNHTHIVLPLRVYIMSFFLAGRLLPTFFKRFSQLQISRVQIVRSAMVSYTLFRLVRESGSQTFLSPETYYPRRATGVALRLNLMSPRQKEQLCAAKRGG